MCKSGTTSSRVRKALKRSPSDKDYRLSVSVHQSVSIVTDIPLVPALVPIIFTPPASRPPLCEILEKSDPLASSET
jgi:hypothetical protein